MMIFNKKINKHIKYVLANFFQELKNNPSLMRSEIHRFIMNCTGYREKPKWEIAFENHCHSSFSDGLELVDLVNTLFERKIRICSITDHGNSFAFDSLKSGRYNLNKKYKERCYELDINRDGRSMIINSGGERVIILRSIEYMTNKGEIGVHGYQGNFPREKLPLSESIKRATDMGGFVVINHPYFWEGIGFHGERTIEEAVMNGASAIEKNGTEIPPQIYSPVRVMLASEKFQRPIITSGDAHKKYMYGLSGISFKKEEYYKTLAEKLGNDADAVKKLVAAGRFQTYLNYLNPKQFFEFFCIK